MSCPSFPGVEGNQFFQAQWAREVQRVMAEDDVGTEMRPGMRRSTVAASAETDAVEALQVANREIWLIDELLKHLVEPYRDHWVPLRMGSKLTASQVMIGASLLLEEAYGRHWPISCRLTIGLPTEGTVCRWSSLPPSDLPLMGFAVIYTSDHWALLWSFDGKAQCYDGLNLVSLKLAEAGHYTLEQIGMLAADDIAMVPGSWQRDSWSCGWWLLRCLQAIVVGKITRHNQNVPDLDPAELEKETALEAAMHSDNEEWMD